MVIIFDPSRITPPPRGGLTLSIFRGVAVTFKEPGQQEIPDGIAQHPDFPKLVESGAIAIVEPKPEPAPKTSKTKSSGGAKNTPDPG